MREWLINLRTKMHKARNALGVWAFLYGLRSRINDDCEIMIIQDLYIHNNATLQAIELRTKRLVFSVNCAKSPEFEKNCDNYSETFDYFLSATSFDHTNSERG